VGKKRSKENSQDQLLPSSLAKQNRKREREEENKLKSRRRIRSHEEQLDGEERGGFIMEEERGHPQDELGDGEGGRGGGVDAAAQTQPR